MAFSKLTLIMMRNMLVLRCVAALPALTTHLVPTLSSLPDVPIQAGGGGAVLAGLNQGALSLDQRYSKRSGTRRMFEEVETGWLVPGVEVLYVHVDGPHLARLVLLHPQLAVFGWVHVLQQLVHRLHHLRTHKT